MEQTNFYKYFSDPLVNMRNEKLSFCYPLSQKGLIEAEKRIKSYIRKFKLDVPSYQEIERYCDVQNHKLPDEEIIRQTVSIGILSAELIEAFGGMENNIAGEIDDSFSSEESNNCSEESCVNHSEEDENDYMANFDEDENDLTEENPDDKATF